MNRPIFYILGFDKVYGTVYEKNGKKVVFMYETDINLENGFEFCDYFGNKMHDPEILELLLDFLYPAETQ